MTQTLLAKQMLVLQRSRGKCPQAGGPWLSCTQGILPPSPTGLPGGEGIIPPVASLGGAPRRRFTARPLSLTILCFHVEAESQVLVRVQRPVVTGCCHVQHQPALVLSSERLKIQKEQVRLPVDMKEQLTEGRHSRLCVPRALPGDR